VKILERRDRVDWEYDEEADVILLGRTGSDQEAVVPCRV